MVADIDGPGVRAVAGELAGRGAATLAVDTDVADGDQVADLVARAESAFGPIDVFCANAGVLVAGGVEVPPATWDRLWAVNVMSHVHAARAVLPSMLSAAGAIWSTRPRLRGCSPSWDRHPTP